MFEQFVRVASILLFGYIVVVIFKQDNIYAIYCAIGAAGIAAIASIIFVKLFGRKDEKIIEDYAKQQEASSVDKKRIVGDIPCIP